MNCIMTKTWKKIKLQHQQTIHTNITWTMNTTIKKIFQKTTSFKHQNYQNKKQRFKWIDVMYTTLHFMLVQSENQSLQNKNLKKSTFTF